ncbi:cgi-12 protein-related [Holotrichia oblita]|uniref:Cgi-12 protein-related n=2 Tax=Holotrichia oblita TaxID=644536 RepID=A0ACB9TFL5_HOLOL|nr:cgi-12 protein-related [Holotrichia oblita]
MLLNPRGSTIISLKSWTSILFKCSHSDSLIQHTEISKESYSVIDTTSIPNDDYIDVKLPKKSPLEKCSEDISHIAPYLRPTFNFAAYINRSETLQQLLKLGVNFHKLEQKRNVPTFIMGLDFEKDIKNHVLFFLDRGLQTVDIANIITRNPFILRQDIEDLKVRINYLLYKKFNEDMILRILSRNPFWLMFSTNRIDRRLGYFQTTFSLCGDEVRTITCKQPKLITYSIKHITLNHFSLKEEMGFTKENIKEILIKKPKTFMKNKDNMLKTFDYLVNTMDIPLEMIVTWPEILTCREFRLKHRHLFLKTLGRAQYNPKLPNYVSLLTLVSGEDSNFAVDIAKSSLQAYNAFLKTL